MLHVLIFLLAFLAEWASAVWAVNETRAVMRLQTRSALRWAGLLLLAGWGDYITADKFSLWAAMPGSILGGLFGTYRAIEEKKRKMQQARKLRKRKAPDPELIRSVAEYIQNNPKADRQPEGSALPSTPPETSQSHQE